MITIVIGQPRTGTSLTMMILDKGGIPAIHEPEINKKINPFGSYETRKQIEKKEDADGRCFKCLTAQILFDLPQAEYKVIMPIRNSEQIILSRFEVFQGRQMAGDLSFQKRMIEKTYRFLRFIVNARADMELLEVNYEDYFNNTDETIEKIASFVSVPFNKDEAKKAISFEYFKTRKMEDISGHKKITT